MWNAWEVTAMLEDGIFFFEGFFSMERGNKIKFLFMLHLWYELKSA